jgi:hypothetical protein
VNTADPDIEAIQARVEQAVDRSQARGEEGSSDSVEKEAMAKKPVPEPEPSADEPTTGGSIGSLAEGYKANDSDDLASAC